MNEGKEGDLDEPVEVSRGWRMQERGRKDGPCDWKKRRKTERGSPLHQPAIGRQAGRHVPPLSGLVCLGVVIADADEGGRL